MIEHIRHQLLPLSQPSDKLEAHRCAAVLIPLVKQTRSSQWNVLFTRRAQHLKHHPGQISFPGGGFEAQDHDLSATAVRETHEETGILPENIELLGRLPQQQTISKYNVTPFVGIVNTPYQLNIDQNEVSEVFTAPFDFLTDLTNQQKVTESINGKEYSFYVIQYKHYNIWGATARILVNLTRRLNSAK